MMAEPSRRFPTPWQTDKLLGSYVVRDANGQALPIYTRATTRPKPCRRRCSRRTRRAASPSTSRGCRSRLGRRSATDGDADRRATARTPNTGAPPRWMRRGEAFDRWLLHRAAVPARLSCFLKVGVNEFKFSGSKVEFEAASFDLLIDAVESLTERGGGARGAGSKISASLGRSSRACVRVKNSATRNPWAVTIKPVIGRATGLYGHRLASFLQPVIRITHQHPKQFFLHDLPTFGISDRPAAACPRNPSTLTSRCRLPKGRRGADFNAALCATAAKPAQPRQSVC